jgi:hypothetical protein
MSSSVIHSPAPLLSRSFCSHSRTLMSESDHDQFQVRDEPSQRGDGHAVDDVAERQDAGRL